MRVVLALVSTCFVLGLDAATLNGSSEYAVPEVDFTLTCDVPAEATSVRFYHRSSATTSDQVGSVQLGGTQCYNTQVAPAVICTLGVCSCESSRPGYGTSFQWIIQPQTGDHSSVWYCTTSGLGTSPDYTLKVAVPVTSVELQNPGGQPIDVTDNLSTTKLVCLTSACRPPASVLWLIEATNYTSSSVPSVSSVANDLYITTSTMTFTPTRAMTGQKVICGTYNIGSNVVQATLQPTLNVRYQSETTATLNVSSAIFQENEQISIMCQINGGNPLATITWNCFDGTTSDVSTSVSRRSVTSLTTNSSQNGRQCQCAGTQPLTTITNVSVTFAIKYGPSTVTLSPATTSYNKNEGENISTITCSADCNPACTYSWTKGGLSYTTGATVQFTSIQRGKAGVYSCSATNTYGTKKSGDVTITVNYGPSTVTLSPATTSYNKNEGDTISTITCSGDCNPACTYSWTKGGLSYTTGATVQFTSIQRGKAGVYSCSATNTYGTKKSGDVTITVNYGPSTVTLSPATTSYNKIEGENISTISCSADCNPACTYSWIKGGQLHTTGASLQFTNIQRGEAGGYSCSATNAYGTNKSGDVTITVNYGPGAMTFTPSADVVDKVENETIPNVTCDADCRPACTYTWSKGGTNYANPLSLSKVVRGNAGQYVCTATNIVGQNTKTWNLTVKYPPKILNLTYTSGGVDVIENGDKSLICTVESFPASTIQWYYKANNTQLLSTPDTLESTYTLTGAGCLDTGVYMCSVSNSQSNTPGPVTMDIPVNVLCKPRQDFRVEVPLKYGLGLGENLTIPASFISNPGPSYKWTFHNSSQSAVEDLTSGRDNFTIHNNYNENSLSAVSTGTRRGLQERWFGFYIITATNNHGSATLNYTVEAKGKPKRPYNGNAVCQVKNSAIVSWTSEFNGGSNQTFIVGTKTDQLASFAIQEDTNTTDPGQGNLVYITIQGLAAGTRYFFTVYAVNMFGNVTLLEEYVNCTTKAEPTGPTTLPLGTIIGGIAGSAVAIIAIIVIIIVLRRKGIPGKWGKDDETEMIQNNGRRVVDEGASDGLKPNILYESSDGLKPNILYESSDGLKANILYESGPMPGSSSEYAVVDKTAAKKAAKNGAAPPPEAMYAVVDKSKKPDSMASNDVYAVVDKPNGKGKQKQGKANGDKQKGGKGGKKKNKGAKDGAKDGAQADNVYEQVEPVQAVGGAPDNIYANCKDTAKPTRTTNQDGLIYLDVTFKDDKQNGKKFVIHGDERTAYADVDFNQKAEPLPPDNENDQTGPGGSKN